MRILNLCSSGTESPLRSNSTGEGYPIVKPPKRVGIATIVEETITAQSRSRVLTISAVDDLRRTDEALSTCGLSSPVGLLEELSRSGCCSSWSPGTETLFELIAQAP